MGLALSNPPSGAGKMNNQELVRKAAQQFGFGNQWPALYKLVMAESGFRNTAQNPSSTAYGMFQFLDGTWGGVGGHKTSDPWLQAIYGMRYIKNRYNDPRGAWNFHQAHNWYGNGGVFSGPQMIGVGERGPETVIPLNEQGASFIADIFRKTQVGLDGRATNVTGSVPMGAPSMYNYQIDRSTNFTGAITVQTANPAEFVNQLKQRQRVMALSQAALGGKKP
jgi:SLT domain-containing protein